MRLQQFGCVETGEEILEAMLCMDVDLPGEGMLHCWGRQTPPLAALVRLRETGADRVELSPLALYRADRDGGLQRPRLAPEEIRQIEGFRATLKQEGDNLSGEWRHDSGRRGALAFTAPAAAGGVQVAPCADWDEFKQWAGRSRAEHDAIAFRGHGCSTFRLQTSLHRVGRHRLERYCAETLPQFRTHAEAVSGMRFNLEDGDDYSILLGLAQHHGLPTPLLDWTGSPYIAAFFAFADALDYSELRPESTHVRIYGLTREFVAETAAPVVTLPAVKPYVASLAISPRNNPRLYAQQGLFLATNVADVERFFCDIQHKTGKTFLIAADVPTACASAALEDLAYMGLNAATLFPGLDGVCRMIRHAMSFKRGALPTAGKPAGFPAGSGSG